MTTFKKWIVILSAAIFMMGVMGCGEDDSLEKVGKKADKVIEDAKKSINKIKKLVD
jgi:hypothetical protein